MPGKVGTLDVVRDMLGTVSLSPLDMGGVGDRRPVALFVMADNVVSHLCFVGIYRYMDGYVATSVWTYVPLF